MINSSYQNINETKTHDECLPLGFRCRLHQEILEQCFPTRFLGERCPAFVPIPPCSNTPASNGRYYQASAEAELNQVCLSRGTWKRCRTVFPEDQSWETRIQGPKQTWLMESNIVRLFFIHFLSFLWLKLWDLPADGLWLQMWCAARLYPTGPHTKPGQEPQPSETAAAWPGFRFDECGLTGNLLNRSVNIWEVRGLFLRLRKETRASLKTLVTRSTSTWPMTFS